MSAQIAVRIPERYLAAVDEAVRAGRFPSRAAAVREALERLLAEEREGEIVEQYRRAYSRDPQEDWVGRVGEALMAESIEDLGRDAGR
ncbi:MAG: ribbon-helix-helix domain-containing protein [Thermoleophilaceae bacterium]